MAQHDYIIANGTGASVRSDINGALAAIASNNSSASEPGTTYAYQWWADTTANILKLRNGSNTGWISIATIAGANPGVAGVIPIGGIIMWSGTIATIPVGWGLCNGDTYGAITTPDLRNKFIIGAVVDAVAPGELTATPHATIEGSNKRSGGAATVTLNISQIPIHDHANGGPYSGTAASQSITGSFNAYSYSNGSPSGVFSSTITNSNELNVGSGGGNNKNYNQFDISAGHGHNVNINAEGGGQAHENLPPYYSLAYIMRVA